MEVCGERCIAFYWGGEDDGYPLCKYTQCGPYQMLLLYILIYASLHSIFLHENRPIKMNICTYLLKCFVQPLNIDLKKKKWTKSEKE